MTGRSIRLGLAVVMATSVLSFGCAQDRKHIEAAMTRAEDAARRAEAAASRVEAAAQRTEAAADRAERALSHTRR